MSAKLFLKNACSKEKLLLIFASTKAEVAQLVELQPSKLVVASSSLVFRSTKNPNIMFGFFYCTTLLTGQTFKINANFGL